MPRRPNAPLAPDLRTFMDQLIPLGSMFLSVRVVDGQRFELSYADAEGRHEVATWTPTSWQLVDA